ncbi:MAG TPA: DUF2085 domain-containing protein [Candidatus Sulfomarinibacteraceae bacterium]|nr:DUF2085 domain-containing protein [Candidatus Sulfomarinibacteraceae bacterium]
MTGYETSNKRTRTDFLSRAGRRPWRALLVVLGSLLLLGFYSATNPERLAHDHVLGVMDYAGYTVCHRLTAHSFLFEGRQMPLCARCTGMYLGIMLAAGALLLSGRGRWSDFPSLRLSLVLVGFVGLMGVDGLNSYSHFFPDAPHLYTPQNWLRLTTGMGTGLAMGLFAVPSLAQTLWREPVYRPVLASGRELGGLILLAALTVLLVLSNQSPLLYVLSIVSAAGVVAILTMLNGILLLIVIRREGQVQNWRQALAPLTIALLLALAQIAAISFVRYQLTGTLTGFPGL